MPKIVTREGWGAQPPRGSIATRSSTVATVIHHTTGKTLGKDKYDDWMRGIQQYHFSRGWSDIGYNDCVAPDGTIYNARGSSKVGAHCTGHNSNTYGIALLGDSKNGVSQAAKESIYWLWKSRGKGQVYGHREMSGANTSCPGDPLQAFVKQLRAGWHPVEEVPETDYEYFWVIGAVESPKQKDHVTKWAKANGAKMIVMSAGYNKALCMLHVNELLHKKAVAEIVSQSYAPKYVISYRSDADASVRRYNSPTSVVL